MMKFEEFDNLIMDEVLTHPLSEDDFGGKESEYYKIHKDRIYKTLQIIPDTIGKDVLDLGSEPGYIAIALKMNGYNVIGGSINLIGDFKKRMNQFQIPIDVYNIDYDDLHYSNSTFDVVIFSEIIEHLFYDVPHALKEIYRTVKQDGYLILTTPNLARIANRMRLLTGKSINPPLCGENHYFQKDIYKRHNREYTLQELIHLLNESGFKINRQFYWNYPAYIYRKPMLKRGVNFISHIIPGFKDQIYIVASK